MRQVILNFHGIGHPKRELEEGEAPYWVSEDFYKQTMDLVTHHKDRVHVDITFDDGNLSDVEIGLPVLARHNFHATFFVLADRIGKAGSLGQDDIRALVAAGHQIGSHGAAHIDWASATPTELERELGPITRDTIAAAAGQPVTAAAIPFGRYNAAVLKALSHHDYAYIYSSDGGAWRVGHRPIPRTSPRNNMTLEDIENILLGREPLKARLRRMIAMHVKRLL